MDDSRRHFCKFAGLCLAGAAIGPAPGCSNNHGSSGPIVLLSTSTTDVLMMNDAELTQAPDHNFFVCRDAMGIYAVDGNCTHARCLLEWGNPDFANKFHCSCHGSTFDYNGQNPTMPAPMPLAHYKVIIMGTKIYVDVGTTVDPSTRVAV